MVDLIPEARERSISPYDIGEDFPVPGVGDYLVSICKGRVPGSVYQITAVRKVKSEKYPNRYALRVIKASDMLEHVTISFRFQVMVKDQWAFPLFWYSRNKK